MLIKFSERMVGRVPVEYVTKKFISHYVSYVLDSRYRKATNLRTWIRNQVEEPSDELIAWVESIPTKENTDQQVIEVLRAVQNSITYTSDRAVWDAGEYWATANEVIAKKKDDCDGGAVLAYVACRLKGVPAARLFVGAGNVLDPLRNTTVGHCWLLYRPLQYPINWAFLDWCYYYTTKEISRRNLYYIHNNSIVGYVHDDEQIIGEDKKYETIWFIFNEEQAHNGLKIR